jgi:AcrR family transcriptional regulator
MTMGKGAETRSRVLDRAVAMASSVGLERLSIGELARAAGLSKSGLFAHFASKEDLQLKVLETAADRFIATVVTPALKQPRGEPRVRALFDRWLQWEKDVSIPGGCIFIGVASELDDRPGAARDALVAAQRDWIATLATAARIAVDESHFRADLDTEQFAHDLYSIALAFHFFSRLIRDPEAEERAAAAFERLIATSK